MLSVSSAVSAFLLLLLQLRLLQLLVVLLASAAGASAAAAADDDAAAAATALRTAGWSCSVFHFLLLTLLRKLYGGGCCCTEPSEKFRVRPRHDYEKKHVSRHSKMCCCCRRFCCGAPTTDERIHASVLHDASQIDYCRYRGRASLPPITSIGGRLGPDPSTSSTPSVRADSSSS